MKGFGKFISNWWNVGDFKWWKLHTKMDYVYFACMLAFVFLLFYIIVQLMKKKRNMESALARVEKRLKKYGGKGCIVYTNKHIVTKKDECDCEMIVVATDRIYVVKTYPWGNMIVGSVDSDQWHFKYADELKYEPNPVPDLENQRYILNMLFSRAKLNNIKIEPLVVFADNYSYPSYNIKGFKNCVAYKDIKKWRKVYPLFEVDRIDHDLIKKVLEESFSKEETKS